MPRRNVAEIMAYAGRNYFRIRCRVVLHAFLWHGAEYFRSPVLKSSVLKRPYLCMPDFWKDIERCSLDYMRRTCVVHRCLRCRFLQSNVGQRVV